MNLFLFLQHLFAYIFFCLIFLSYYLSYIFLSIFHYLLLIFLHHWRQVHTLQEKTSKFQVLLLSIGSGKEQTQLIAFKKKALLFSFSEGSISSQTPVEPFALEELSLSLLELQPAVWHNKRLLCFGFMLASL